MIIYAFARITDEMFDNGADSIKQRGDLKLCLEFVNELFADRKTVFHVKRTPEVVKVDWTKYESRFNDTEMAVLRAFARIAFYLPAAPIIELFDDYRWDVDGKVFETEKDLLTYTANAGGINAMMIVLVIWYRERNGKYHDIVEKGKKEPIIQKIYKIGQVGYFRTLCSSTLSSLFFDSFVSGHAAREYSQRHNHRQSKIGPVLYSVRVHGRRPKKRRRESVAPRQEPEVSGRRQAEKIRRHVDPFGKHIPRGVGRRYQKFTGRIEKFDLGVDRCVPSVHSCHPKQPDLPG